MVLEGAREAGAITHPLDLRDYALPIFNGDRRASNTNTDVFRLRETMRNAQGMIIGSPEYHGGISGALKNAIDWMGFDVFEDKLIGLVCTSGEPMGAVNTLGSLRMIARAVHA
ncbi:MAG: NAD(P)H-dependent oxidoreductase [Chloroflexi bacterium]|nr:NAD(P)H-dependent oxidoreductase [Chloroflexota bacterium]